VVDGERAPGEDLCEPDQVEPISCRHRGGGYRRPLRVRLCDPLSHPVLGAEEVVPPLDLVRGLREVAVPRGVVADALREGAAVADGALLDVADLARDARQIALRAGAVVPEVVLV